MRSLSLYTSGASPRELIMSPFRLFIDDAIKALFRAFGLEIQRLSGASTEYSLLRRLLAQLRPSTVLDIGANVGQFARSVRQAGFTGTIISFEAIPEVHARLVERAQDDPHWKVAPCAALGATQGEGHINIAANLASSSLLDMGATHLQAAPESKYVRRAEISIRRLDEVGTPLLPEEGPLYLKVDTQGNERDVLEGATGLLSRVSALQIELSLIPLYVGAPTISEMLPYVESIGFELFGLAPGFKDRSTGRLLQVDGFFVRRGRSQ